MREETFLHAPSRQGYGRLPGSTLPCKDVLRRELNAYPLGSIGWIRRGIVGPAVRFRSRGEQWDGKNLDTQLGGAKVLTSRRNLQSRLVHNSVEPGSRCFYLVICIVMGL